MTSFSQINFSERDADLTPEQLNEMYDRWQFQQLDDAVWYCAASMLTFASIGYGLYKLIVWLL